MNQCPVFTLSLTIILSVYFMGKSKVKASNMICFLVHWRRSWLEWRDNRSDRVICMWNLWETKRCRIRQFPLLDVLWEKKITWSWANTPIWDSLMLHIKRGNYVKGIWKLALIWYPKKLNLADHGWENEKHLKISSL